MTPVKVFAGFFLVIHFLFITGVIAVTCDNEQRIDGTIDSVSLDPLDSRSGEVIVDGLGLTVDPDTILNNANGDPIALSAFQTDELVRARFCPDTPPQPTAVRIDQLTGAPATPPDLLRLDVPPGTESQPVLRVFGDDSADSLGAGITDALAFGDVNGDGFDDMILGVPSANSPAGFTSGEVVVLFGRSDLPASSVDLNTDGAISAAGETRILATTEGAMLGHAVASGDVDGDGLDDLIIGAPDGNTQGPGTGEVVIVYGAKTLPGTVVDLAQAADKTTILGDNAQERTGWSVASGDINADGNDDLIIGAPGASPGASHQGGTVFVIYGHAGLRGATIDLNTDGAIGTALETRIFGDRSGDETGSSVASGDINGDGFDDVIIGADRANALFTTDRGATYVIYGRDSLAGTIVDLSSTTDAVGPAGETRIFGRVANSWLGASVASGDINNDGFDDVVMSATGIKGVGDNFQVGEVYALYGSATLPGTVVDLNRPPGTFGDTRITGTEEFVEFGFSVASADVTGDGFDDLILGAPQSVPPGEVDNAAVNDGLVFLFHGSQTLAGQQLTDPREVADLIVVRDSPGDLWGYSAEAGGDLDRNGVPEYAASANLGDNPSIGGDNNAGYSAAIFGLTAALSSTRTEHSTEGDAPATDFGPVIRAKIDYASGSAASTDAVTLTRGTVANPPQAAVSVLPLQWQLASDRNGFTADITFGYTDAELGTADEGRLVVFASATGAADTWVVAGSAQEQDLLRNEITVMGIDSFSLFVIAEAARNVASILPGSRAVALGGTATAFATMINTGSVPLSGCSIAPATPVAASFLYQTTDPATNTLTGTPDTAVDLGAGASRSFLIAFTPAQAIPATEISFDFSCNGAGRASVIPGVNTFILSATAVPGPDVIALAASSPPGQVVLASAGAFAVATANVGTAGTLEVSADTGSAALPVTLSICQTDPGTGSCINPAVPTTGPLNLSIGAGETPTFAVFISADVPIAFDPAVNRVFFRIRNQSGETVALTSVAVSKP